MKGMDIDGVNKKLSSIVGESIDVGVYDKSMKPTLIESIKSDIKSTWDKVQAIERGEKVPLTEATEINEEAVDQKTAIKHLYRLFRGRTAGIDFRVLIKNIKDNPEGKFRLLRKGNQTIVVDDNDKEMGSWSSKKLNQESKEKWVIKDWAGNYPFQKGGYQGSGHLNKPEMVFDSFEDAEEWLTNKLGKDYENDREEFEIEQIDESMNEWPSTDDKPLGTMGEAEVDPRELYHKMNFLYQTGKTKEAIELAKKLKEIGWEDKGGMRDVDHVLTMAGLTATEKKALGEDDGATTWKEDGYTYRVSKDPISGNMYRVIRQKGDKKEQSTFEIPLNTPWGEALKASEKRGHTKWTAFVEDKSNVKSAEAFRNVRDAMKFKDAGGVILDPSDEETEMSRSEIIEYFSNEGGSWPEESVNEAQGMDLLDRAKEYMQNGGAWAVGLRDVKDFLKEYPKSSWKELKAMMDEAQKEELMDADHMVDRLPGEDVDEGENMDEAKSNTQDYIKSLLNDLSPVTEKLIIAGNELRDITRLRGKDITQWRRHKGTPPKEIQDLVDELSEAGFMNADLDKASSKLVEIEKELKSRLEQASKEESSEIQEKKLTYAQRKSLPASDFVFPKERKYPINDIARGRNALARVGAFGTPSEKKTVKAAVYAKYPSLKEEEGKLVGQEGTQDHGKWANFNEAFTEYMKSNS